MYPDVPCVVRVTSQNILLAVIPVHVTVQFTSSLNLIFCTSFAEFLFLLLGV